MQYKNIVRFASVIFTAIVMPAIVNAQVDDGDGMGNGLPPGVVAVAPSKSSAGNGMAEGMRKSDPNYPVMLAKRVAEAEKVRLASLKDLLGSPDSEWAVIEPKLKQLQLLQTVSGAMNVSSSAIKNPATESLLPKCIVELRAAQQELSRVIAGQAGPEDLRTRLAKVREARDEVRKQLAQVQQDLLALLTVQQEAILFQRGLLD